MKKRGTLLTMHSQIDDSSSMEIFGGAVVQSTV